MIHSYGFTGRFQRYLQAAAAVQCNIVRDRQNEIFLTEDPAACVQSVMILRCDRKHGYTQRDLRRYVCKIRMVQINVLQIFSLHADGRRHKNT